MNELPPDYSPRASTFITTSTSNSPPLTPTSTIYLPSYATTLSGRNEEPIFASAAPYFELRPPPTRLHDRRISFRIAVDLDSHLFNIPFPRPEEIWLERDVQFQDWMTFINFMIPPPETAQEVNATKSGDQRNIPHSDTYTGLEEETSGESRRDSNTNCVGWQGQIVSQRTKNIHNLRVDSVIKEWNEDFFLPRGLEIIRDVESPISEQGSVRNGLESHVESDLVNHFAQGPTLADNGCAMARKKSHLPLSGRNSSLAAVDSPLSTIPTSNPRLEQKFMKAASKGIEKAKKWDQALLEKMKDREPQFLPSTPNNDIAFYQAVSRGDKSTAKQLIESGVNLDVKNSNGVPALFRAVSRGDSSMVKLLLETPIDVNASNSTGETSIYRAVVRGDSTIVKMLLDSPVDTNAKTASGDMPIYRAASRGDSTIVKLLLRKSPGIDVNARAQNGKTALYRSVARGDSTIVKILLDSGADVNQAVDGDLPISKATSRGNHTLAKILSKKLEEQDSVRHASV